MITTKRIKKILDVEQKQISLNKVDNGLNYPKDYKKATILK